MVTMEIVAYYTQYGRRDVSWKIHKKEGFYVDYMLYLDNYCKARNEEFIGVIYREKTHTSAI